MHGQNLHPKMIVRKQYKSESSQGTLVNAFSLNLIGALYPFY